MGADAYIQLTFVSTCPSMCFVLWCSDSPHSEPPLVDEPAPDTVSDPHNSDDGEFKNDWAANGFYSIHKAWDF